ncbi:MAG TPA: family 20 glycosylhydrolase, partial [Bacteroidota bacterium]|nr:family 20 glycosylhydrolase [Bacteroidota bacterium]
MKILSIVRLLVFTGAAAINAGTDGSADKTGAAGMAGAAGVNIPVIPRPAVVEVRDGVFIVNGRTGIVCDGESGTGAYLRDALARPTGYPLPVCSAGGDAGPASSGTPARSTAGPSFDRKNSIRLTISNDSLLGTEGYRLDVGDSGVDLRAASAAGLFYGSQTLLQLLPPEIFRPGRDTTIQWTIPYVAILDTPQFQWRGMHLDVCRHFFPVDFIKRYIDLIAMYKMNTFHWHLTDDQGWRIDIRRYPRLTEVGAWRDGSMVGPYSDMRFDSARYGGYYTQDDVRGIVAYAAARHVTVVPEIEMPGHSLAALAGYPELSCTGGPFEVGKAWGVYDDVYCPTESTFAFLENVLDEVCDLFPGTYIHIGGDECPKTRWKACPRCQARLSEEGLADEYELQSWFIRRIEKFLNGRGKQIIGWDEILEGGLAPNAAVMSWRGTDGGIAAARQGHRVVMSPGSHCYFDHYQGDPKFEPLAIGGFTTVEKVYSYEPVPEELNAAGAGYIMGAQGNLWTEYIATPEQAEYMAVPRMSALSEVLWSPRGSRSWDGFLPRLVRHLRVLDALGVRYSTSFYQLKAGVGRAKDGGGVVYMLESPLETGEIRYTADGSDPTPVSDLFGGPVRIDSSLEIRAGYFSGGSRQGPVLAQRFTVSLSTGRPVTLKSPPHPDYPGEGAFTLVDGVRGDVERFGRDWLGFQGPDLDAVVDLGTETTVSGVTVDFFRG